MKQSKQDLEIWWKKEDAWGYQTNNQDKIRKEKILNHLKKRYKRALDIGAGEGFITKDLPAEEIFAYEISDNASSRLPENVKRIKEIEGKYDLIIATGVLYQQYDWRSMLDIIKNHASGTILLSNIASWEVKEVEELGKPVLIEEYPYREYTQRLRIYEIGS